MVDWIGVHLQGSKMAIISEDQLELRLNHENNLLRGSGRTLGAKNIPDKIRELIGYNAHFATAEVVADGFNVAPITAHLAKRSENHPEVGNKIAAKLEEARDDALTKMMAAMGVVTVEKLEEIKSLKKAMSIARDFSHIIDKITPKQAPPTAGAQILIYAPQVNEETSYESIVVENQQ